MDAQAKYDSFYKLGYQDGYVWNAQRKLPPSESEYQDSYDDGLKDGLFKVQCEREDAAQRVEP